MEVLDRENSGCGVEFTGGIKCNLLPSCVVLINDKEQGKTPENLIGFLKNLPLGILRTYVINFNPETYRGDCKMAPEIFSNASRILDEAEGRKK